MQHNHRITRRRITESAAVRSFLMEAADTSLNERMDAVRRAVSAKFNSGPGDYCYTEVVFDTYVIVSKGNKLWRLDYTVGADGTVVLAADTTQVRVTYTPVNEGVLFGLLPDSDVPRRG
jgi:hypothetical protein